MYPNCNSIGIHLVRQCQLIMNHVHKLIKGKLTIFRIGNLVEFLWDILWAVLPLVISFLVFVVVCLVSGHFSRLYSQILVHQVQIISVYGFLLLIWKIKSPVTFYCHRCIPLLVYRIIILLTIC